jgi:hypothetical protein
MNATIKASILPYLLLCAGLAQAGDWTDKDTAVQAVVLSTFAVDYMQTKDIKNHKWAYETNPIMGKHPSDVRIRNYFISAAVIHTAIAYKLPPEWRKPFQYATIAVQVVTIIKNKRMGLNYEF